MLKLESSSGDSELNAPDGSRMRLNQTNDMMDRVVIHQCQATLLTPLSFAALCFPIPFLPPLFFLSPFLSFHLLLSFLNLFLNENFLRVPAGF